MKYFYMIFLFLFGFSCSTFRSYQKTSLYLDQDDNPISEEEYDEMDDKSKWLFISEEGEKVKKIAGPKYEMFYTNYASFQRKIENITGKNFSENSIFLIEYTYKNDLCFTDDPNNWKRSEVRQRKDFFEPIIKNLKEEYPNLFFLKIYEEGIKFPFVGSPEKEYFFTDTGNFLRNSIFKNPAYCGSYALLKPDGNILVRNGEHRPDWMAQNLEKWDSIFTKID